MNERYPSLKQILDLVRAVHDVSGIDIRAAYDVADVVVESGWRCVPTDPPPAAIEPDPEWMDNETRGGRR